MGAAKKNAVWSILRRTYVRAVCDVNVQNSGGSVWFPPRPSRLLARLAGRAGKKTRSTGADAGGGCDVSLVDLSMKGRQQMSGASVRRRFVSSSKGQPQNWLRSPAIAQQVHPTGSGTKKDSTRPTRKNVLRNLAQGSKDLEGSRWGLRETTTIDREGRRRGPIS